jgi:hypothetical protein
VQSAAGEPVAGAEVTLAIAGAALAATTGADGSFRFAGLAPGARFRVEARDPATGLGAAAEGIAPSGGNTIRITLFLAPAGTLTGRVLTADGEPAAETTVTLRASGSAGGERSAATAADGAFAFPFVPLGGFQLSASRPDGDFGQLAGSLSIAGEVRTVDIRLAGLGALEVTVRDGGGQPAAGAEVTAVPVDGSRRSATTDTGGLARFPVLLAGRNEISAFDPATGLSAAGQVLVERAGTSSLTLGFPALGAIAGRVLRGDGTTPAAGFVVTLSSRRFTFRSAVSTEDGGFRFAALRIDESPFRLEVLAGGRTVGRESDLILAGHGQELQRDVVLVPLGQVNGRLLDPDGAPVPGLAVTLTATAPLGGGTFPAVSDAEGGFRIANVPAGSFQARALDPERGLAAEASGQVTRDGEEIALDLRLLANTTFLPYELTDVNGFLYRVQGDGQLSAPFLFDGAPRLAVTRDGEEIPFTGAGLGLLSSGRRQVTLRQTLAGLEVSRRIEVPAGGFAARYVELLANPGGDAVTVDLTLRVRPAPFNVYGTLLATSSGRAVPRAGGSDPDRWAVIAGGASGRTLVSQLVPFVAVVWDGVGGAFPAAEVTFGESFPGELAVRFRGLGVPAGGQAALLHFLALQATPDSARAAAERLSLLPPEGLDALAAEELAAVANWALPADGRSTLAPLPPVRSRTVRGTCRAGDGRTPLPGGTVAVRAENLLFSRSFFATVGFDGTFQLSGILLPDGPFRVTARRTVEGVELTASTMGDSDAPVEVVFAGTGVITGRVRDAAGQSVSALVQGAGQVFAGDDGRFTLAGVPAGVYLLSARRGAETTGAFVTVPADGEGEAVLDFPLLGMVNARVLTPDGAPVPGIFVTLTLVEGSGARSAFTDADGRALFPSVVPNLYTVAVPQPETGQITRAEIVVTGGATASPTLTLAGTAEVDGRVTSTAGDPFPGLTVILVPEAGTLPGAGGGGGSLVAESAAAPETAVEPATWSLYAQTDAGGRFLFPNAPLGSFTLVALGEAAQATATGRVDQPGDAVTVDVVFPPLGRVRVTALQDGQPAAGRFVLLRIVGNAGDADERTLYGSTDEAGQYLSPLLLPGEVTVTVFGDLQLAARGTLTSGTEILDVTPAAPVPGGRLTGTVRAADGSPLAGASVTAADPLTGAAAYAQTDETGAFLLDGATATDGTVRVTVSFGELTEERVVPLPPAGEEAVVDVTLPLAPVRISLRAATGGLPDPGFFASVSLRFPDGSRRYANFVGEGELFLLVPLPAPSFEVRAELYTTGLVVALDGGIADGESAAAFTLTLPPVGQLSGRVLDADGSPVSVPIEVASAGGSRQANAAFSDGDGRFALAPLPLAPFTLVAGQPGGPRARVEGVLAAAEQEITITLPRAGLVEVAAPGMPFGFARLFPAGEPEGTSLFASLEGGAYRFAGVPPGYFAVLQSSPPAAAGGRVALGEPVQISLPAEPLAGAVYGEVRNAAGGPFAGVYVTVLTAGPDGPLPQVAFTDSQGRYLARGVLPGPVAALTHRGGFGPVAGAAGMLPAGGALRLDLQVGASTVLPLPAAFAGWTAERALSLSGGPLNNDLRLRVNGLPFSALDWARLVQDGAGLEMGPAPGAGVKVERRLYAPAGAVWVRYLEVVENPGAEPVPVRVEIAGEAAGAAAQSSEGRWVVVAGGADRPALGFVVGSGSGAGPVEEVFTSEEVQFQPRRSYRYAWERTLAPGERAAWLHFLIVGEDGDPAAVARLAEALATLTEPGADAGIPLELREEVRNF